MSFVKLDVAILDSSLWVEDPPTRIVFVTLLVMADAQGMVEATAPGIARRANLPLKLVRPALEKLEAPDPDSRTTTDEGRRIARIDGGYVVLNYAKYRAKRDPEIRRAQTREATRRWRDRRVSQGEPAVSQREPRRAQAEAEAEAEGETDRGITPQQKLASVVQELGTVTTLRKVSR